MKRLRDYGIRLHGLPTGPRNTITDVEGVAVGHCTVIEGETIRTGVTAILPHTGNLYSKKVPAAAEVFNGFGKAAGLTQIQELGEIETPILVTNTLSIGAALDALVHYKLERNPRIGLPSTVNGVVLECNDSFLNDIRALYISRDHVRTALSAASRDMPAEGNVGAGTGMTSFGVKGGVGTSSRVAGGYTCGVLVVSNFGRWEQLKIAGVPVGRLMPRPAGEPTDDSGSIIMVVATDAPLDARQLRRLARRAPLGLARTGSVAGHGSGDYVVAFSTMSADQPSADAPSPALPFPDSRLNPLFEAVVEATEEAILNALFMAETMTGRDGNTRHALPIEDVLRVMREFRAVE